MSHSAAQPGRPSHDDGDARPGTYAGRQHPVAALVLIALGIGVFAGLVGLAPWAATGMVLPVQNLWAFQTMPEDMPVALLPLSQYMAIRIVGLMVTGGLVAALGLRWWAPARHWTAVGWAAAGLLLVQVAAAVQSFSVLGDGLLMGSMGDLYFYGLLAGVVAAIAAAVLVLLAVRSRSKAVAALGIGLAAVPAGEWLFAWGEVFWESFALPPVVSMLGHWFPAVLAGLALAWCPPDRMGRAAVWVVDLALLWTVPVLFDAVAGALGTRVFRGDLALMQEYAAGSFTAALDSPGAVGTVVLAAALGVAGVLVRMVSRRTA
ncbi:hypothetical protein [Arthrobacter sp. zg-Y1143]|uniref:hypothetical protein n=1 Tax=Arthrobacter sp. zg-Y1143 TaxID=3049065 RepID=UPI0024C359E7|nr:hypothetical protein [Arthrobacter sp. zg-Y1143]MDK1326458.1 hypothetical protein [Arthrobacter sp. zg-Y1143]